jgi:multiple sugar transport system ATP-binding protein
MPELRFNNVQKSFGSAVIVRDLTLTVHDGEFFTFVGPSGCGKSTILNMIAGLEPVSSGEILFNGKLMNELSPKDRDVAMVFQSYALYPHMTVEENIAFPLIMRGGKKADIRGEVKRVAGLLGIDELIAKKPGQLSGGQRQRVALGRAIIRKPAVFLMDEPLSNLDARLRIEMRAELKKLHQELGITTIYVTHDQGEAMALSDRIAVLHQGTIQQVDAPNEVYRKPSNVFVAEFIGSPAMNMLTCPVMQEKPLTIDCNGVLISLPATVAPGTKRVLVGIRPEDAPVEIAQRENSRAVTVSVVEPEGAFNWVNVIWGDRTFKGISRPDDGIRTGDKAFLSFERERISVFDEGTGVRLER